MELKSSVKLKCVKWGMPLFLLLFCISAIFPVRALCDGIDTWTNRTLGANYSLYGVAYGNSTFVAVGNEGKILTSPDGVTWTTRTSGTDNYLKGVAYGNSTFVAVGESGIILQSGSVTTTEPTPTPTAECTATSLRIRK